jgi:hypothetical protein
LSELEPQRGRCPRCSVTLEPLQEYCLECGLRLPQQRWHAVERASLELDKRHISGAGWLVPALLGLVVAILGTGAALALSDRPEQTSAPSTATGGSLTLTDLQQTLTAPEPPAATAPAARAARPAAPAPPRRPAVPRAITWPPGKRGWTIVLLSMPQVNGRSAATERAEEARRRGLRRVGVLDSARYASLKPGYYVVFHGVFDSEAEATSALQRARGVFRLAYPREIVP